LPLPWISLRVRRLRAAALYAYVTVAYDTVGCARPTDEFFQKPR
jgi:hypothetical protein